MEEKLRSIYIDNIKGLLIILVVLGHYLFDIKNKDIINIIIKIIYIFHMPMFVFITGYLSKNANSRSKKNLIKLFAYYLLFNTIMILIDYNATGTFKLFTPYFSYWYIIAVIIWRLLVDKFNFKKYLIIVLFMCAILVRLFKIYR